MTIHRLLPFAISGLLASSAFAWEQGEPTEEGYTEEPLFWSRPNPGRDYDFGPVGVTGLVIDFAKGKVLKVRETTPETPAAAKFQPGEELIAVGVTGVKPVAFEGRDPQRLLGEALTRAEATDGKLVFNVKRGTDVREVAITIPVLGAYSPAWPLKCAKSDKIIKQAVAFYGGDAFLNSAEFKSRGVEGALACLFLLSTGDDAQLPKVKGYLAGTGVTDSTWFNGYNGIVCGEYVLRTGDQSMLPLLQGLCDGAKRSQRYNSGWGHYVGSYSPSYMAGSVLNAAGTQVLTSLLLASECGIEVDRETLLGGLKFIYRFTGHGTVPYGDHRCEGGLGSNGKDGMAAAAMQVASGAKGDVSIYLRARDHFAASMLHSYPVLVQGHGDEGRSDAIWRSLTSSYLRETQPELYSDAMNRLRWWFDLCRRPSGGFGLSLTGTSTFNNSGSGAAVALAFTAPRKTLRITGAPRSPHAVDFTLPAKLWGNDADLVFHSTKAIERYDKLAADEPIHAPFYRFGCAYGKTRYDKAKIAKPEILKWIGHPNYLIRTQAAKALREVAGPKEIENLLRYPDPRVRRAGLDGWIDYNFFFDCGPAAISGDEITPGMLTAIRKMLADPNESWWVVDGALMAMSFASARDVRKALPLILPWTKHEEWWLRQSAFQALGALEKDEPRLLEHLPTLVDVLARESHALPRIKMTELFARLLSQNKDNETGRRILEGLLEAARKTVVLTDKDGSQRSLEGKYNVFLALDAAANRAPESEMLQVARSVAENFESMATGDLVKLVATPNHNHVPESPVAGGLYPALQGLPSSVAGQLKALLGDAFLPELLERWEIDRQNAALSDSLADLMALKNPGAGWKPLGKNKPDAQEWLYMTFDVPEESGLHRTPGGLVTNPPLEAKLQNWATPDFDDRAWTKGRAPIGGGIYKWQHSPFTIANRSPWGEGEFILARTTFDYDGAAHTAFRIRVLAPKSYQVYLNGSLLHQYVWYKDMPHYHPLLLDEGQIKRLRTGTNLLAVYANRTDRRGPAQLDVVIECLDLKDFVP